MAVGMKTFYWYFRPLATFFKVMGTFPLDNVSSLDTSKLRFRLFGWPHIYSSAIFLISITLIVILIKSIEHTNKILLVCFVVYVMMGRSIASFLMYGAHSFRQLPQLIQLMDNFDRRKQEIIKEQRDPRRNLFWLTIFPAIFIVVTIGVTSVLCLKVINTIFAEETDLGMKKVTSVFLFGFVINMEVFLSLQYIYFAKNIAARFREINKTMIDLGLTTDYMNNLLPKYPLDMYVTLCKIRLLHNMMNESVSQLGSIFGSFIAMDQLFFIGMFVLNISVYLIFYANVQCLLYLTFQYGSIVLGVMHTSHTVKDYVSTSAY